MKFLVAVATLLSPVFALAECSPSSPCSFATNISWDSAGSRDSRPGAWGTADVIQTPIPFVNVPAGSRVLILSVSGDQVAAPNCTPPATPHGLAYTLAGLTNSTPDQSPFVAKNLGSRGTLLYKQLVVAPSGGLRDISGPVSPVPLNPDHILILKQALYLDTFGPDCPVHMELTLTINFAYIPE